MSADRLSGWIGSVIMALLVWSLLTEPAIDGPLIAAVILTITLLIRIHYLETRESRASREETNR